MAAHSNADEVFVALPETYEDGLSVLSWVVNYFPPDKTKIMITHVITSPIIGLCDLGPWLIERDEMEVLNKYLSHCDTYKFQAAKLVYVADDIIEGIVTAISQHGAKNLVIGSAANSDMTDLASEKANKVMQNVNMSCKLWFVFDGSLIFTRERNSNHLTPAPISEVRSQRNGQQYSETTVEMLHDASTEADNFKKMVDGIFGGHEKMAHLLNKLEKDQLRREIRELKETSQREMQEKDQLRREIEEIKVENDLLKSQRDEYFKQIQVENERRLALEKQVSDFELEIKDLQFISASAGDCVNSLQAEVYNLQQERDNFARIVEELCIEKENMQCGSSTAASNSEFSIQELQQATQNFSDSLIIGVGGYGSVYKGSFRRTTVAIKLLNYQSLQGLSQFQQEVTILTKVRHPNLVTLIGACSEVSALVYEYLPNGSLEDRLTCANNTPPLTWQVRTRIIGEICLALIFLHSNKPQLVVHGDLKPANILLDTNLGSKLSDFGISRLLKQPDTNSTAFFETSHPAGTLSYIDPEYVSTGILTPKSDIYSFGIIILRLITGKPPFNIARQVQDAMRDGTFLSVIDELAGIWPFEQAKELANIALRCASVSRSERPDLVNEVWAVVEPLMKAASTCVEVEPWSHGSEFGEENIPSHFICPILQEVMQDPCIAADGFTYEADAIRQWLSSGHNTSPMTNLELAHHNLIPNRVLHSAILEWLQQHPQS